MSHNSAFTATSGPVPSTPLTQSVDPIQQDCIKKLDKGNNLGILVEIYFGINLKIGFISISG